LSLISSEFIISDLIFKNIREVINSYLNDNNLPFDEFKIEIQFNYSKEKITYQSFICLFLAKKYSLNSLDFAHQIAQIFGKNNQNISINISGNGWLEFTVNNTILSNWLKKISFIKFSQLSPSKLHKQDLNNLNFNLYYIHARFCSILRSVHNQKIIKLSNLEFELNNWKILNIDEILAKNIFLSQTWEYKLIKELLFITELIYKNSIDIDYYKTLIKLSNLMFKLEKYCQIWGTIKEQNLPLCQARLNLIAIALYYYQNLFYYQFQTKLPTEL
jgi:hypothetical protein